MIANALFGRGHVADEIFEFVEFGKPFISLVEMLDGGVNAGGEGFGVFGGDGVGADQFDLLVEAVLFGTDKLEIGAGLFAALLAFAQHVEPLEAGTEIALAGVKS